MKDTSKWTITREPATYEGIEYSKIVYRVRRLGFNPTETNIYKIQTNATFF